MPTLRSAVRLAEKGYITGGCKRNKEYLDDKMAIDKDVREGLIEVALDPQTSGGLLDGGRQAPCRQTARRPARRRSSRRRLRVGYATSLAESPGCVWFDRCGGAYIRHSSAKPFTACHQAARPATVCPEFFLHRVNSTVSSVRIAG